MNLKFKTILKFFLAILISIITVYYTPEIISAFYFLVLLILYWRSNDEPFWFSLFFVLSDGFMGFFGAYQATIPLFPGLPPIEVAQFYILLSVLKARKRTQPYAVFYSKFLSIMGVYVLFLIVIGFLFGINSTPNDYFRVIKLTFPLLLFYSLPKLFRTSHDFIKAFSLIFPVAILAFVTQMFDIVGGQSLTGLLGARGKRYFDVLEGQIYRGFYNPNIILVSLFGALYFSLEKRKYFSLAYLYIIVLTSTAMAFLSATRGWILAFGFISILYALIQVQRNSTRFVGFAVVATIVIIFGLKNPFIQKQATRSTERFATMEAVAKGDLTAGGTATRATDQSKRVMDKWKESPVFGWGFSEEYRKYMNEHVGNQTILLHSGIIGASIMFIFFSFFNLKLLKAAINQRKWEALIFLIFFLGWFIIHSTSGQHFGYYQMPKNIMAQSMFFSFGALVYWNSKTRKNG